MIPRGSVQQIVIGESGLPQMRYRTRDLSLFTLTEWGWSKAAEDRHIFPTFEEAETHAAELTKAGERNVYAVVKSEAPEAPRVAPGKVIAMHQPGSVSPQEHFERLERRHLA